jgi:outer membrane protein assembly factor BamB
MFVLRTVPIVALLLCANASAADWPQWRGPNRDGKSPETGLLASWPKGGPRLVWKAQGLGEGYSQFAVVGSRLYTQGQQGGQQFVLAIDANTGKQLWKTLSGRTFGNDKGNGPRGTPTIDGNRLYALAADGMLLCLDIESGKRIWGFNIGERFGGSVPRWGYSESPLVEGDRIIVTPGGRGAAVVALNKATGDLIWKSQDDGAGYSSAIPFDLGGTRGLAILTGGAAIGLDMKNGGLLWRYAKIANKVANIATPIVSDGHVFVSSDYNTGCALLKLTAEGGSVKASEVYFNRDMQNHYTTSVLVGDYLYGFSGNETGILTAMEFKTGKVAWRDRSVGKGNCIYAEQRLYCLGEEGTVGLIEPTPAGYKEISRFEIKRGNQWNTWTPPVVANGRLYLRDQDTVYAYDIKR